MERRRLFRVSLCRACLGQEVARHSRSNAHLLGGNRSSAAWHPLRHLRHRIHRTAGEGAPARSCPRGRQLMKDAGARWRRSWIGGAKAARSSRVKSPVATTTPGSRPGIPAALRQVGERPPRARRALLLPFPDLNEGKVEPDHNPRSSCVTSQPIASRTV